MTAVRSVVGVGFTLVFAASFSAFAIFAFTFGGSLTIVKTAAAPLSTVAVLRLVGRLIGGLFVTMC